MFFLNLEFGDTSPASVAFSGTSVEPSKMCFVSIVSWWLNHSTPSMSPFLLLKSPCFFTTADRPGYYAEELRQVVQTWTFGPHEVRVKVDESCGSVRLWSWTKTGGRLVDDGIFKWWLKSTTCWFQYFQWAFLICKDSSDLVKGFSQFTSSLWAVAKKLRWIFRWRLLHGPSHLAGGRGSCEIAGDDW